MVPFTKASACGNDFIIIDGAHAPEDIPLFSRQICDRHNGVGADGVEWLFHAQDADVHALLINADGSEAEISGNGTRCVSAWLVSNTGKDSITVHTGAGVKSCQLVSRNGNHFEFEMDMGVPQVSSEVSIKTAYGEVRGTPVSMGNPQYIILVKEFPAAWQVEAAEIARDPHFPHGVNIEFVRVQSRNDIAARFFERGVGETQSSGTGSCASAAAAIAAGHVDSPVNVHAPGGTQVVRWAGNRIFLRGPAQLICRGEFLT